MSGTTQTTRCEIRQRCPDDENRRQEQILPLILSSRKSIVKALNYMGSRNSHKKQRPISESLPTGDTPIQNSCKNIFFYKDTTRKEKVKLVGQCGILAYKLWHYLLTFVYAHTSHRQAGDGGPFYQQHKQSSLLNRKSRYRENHFLKTACFRDL